MRLGAALIAVVILTVPAPQTEAGACNFGGAVPTVAWSPEGDLLATAFATGVCPVANVVVTDGTTFKTIATSATVGPANLAWSPDGERLAAGYYTRLVVYDLGSGAPREIAAGSDPSWSPDGELIAYSHAPDGVHVVSPDAGNDHRIAAGRRPAWSPEGDRVAYERDGSVFVATDDGTDEERVTNGEHPSWSPEADAIAVQRESVTFFHPLDGSAETRLGAGRLLQWSPSGEVVALLDPAGVVQLVELGTGKTQRVAEDVVAAGLTPEWDRLATLVPAGRRPELYFSAPNGARPRRISGGQCDEYSAHCVDGTDRGDRIIGTNARDVVFSGAGDDRVRGRGGDDRIDTAYGRDLVDAGPGIDVVHTLANDDRISGGRGRDFLIAGNGEDVVSGGPGRDWIDVARDGRVDRVRCGPGRDLVRADRVDRVARDCETVRRS